MLQYIFNRNYSVPFVP